MISVKSTKKLTAKVRVNILEKGNIVPREKELEKGADLFLVTARQEHKKGFIVKNISAEKENSYIEFENGQIYKIQNEVSKFKIEIFRYQIRATIQEHFTRQQELKKEGIKVLSLFFVDRVSNYVDNGVIRKLFEEEFNFLKKSDSYFKNLNAEEVQGSYFSEYKTKEKKTAYTDLDDEKDALSDKEEIKLMCEKIMSKKELLLSFEDKTCFIFSHSAIREGWDNPNVFQICTLKQSHSEINRRQER